ncbi:MAG: aminopeptidase [Pseudomonadota bacterium]
MTEHSKKIMEGARQAVLNCVKLKEGEGVVIITDLETEALAEAIEKVASELTNDIHLFVMEDFGDRSEDGSDPLEFPREIVEAMRTSKASFYIAQGKPGELKTFRRPMLKFVEEFKLKHAHMIGFEEKMMEEGMAADYKAIQALSLKVYNEVKHAKKIRVTTPSGTDITAEFSPDYKWHISDGDIRPLHWMNLPDGEVFTAPKSVNGHVVIDGTLGDYFSEKYGSLDKNPVEFDLKEGEAVKGSIKCKNEELKNDLEKYVFGGVENAERVGEFAIGTNIGLDHLIGNLLQDEKFPGVHIALGDSYPDKTGAPWHSEHHIDGVMKNTTIIVDDKPLMKDGLFLI